ncbi:hypothetical protein [Chryseobacterium sp.]|uniref:hypothetical protein n=1 Tax=Chryseobacterium sp. TaxID=1871047 RepID=UPI00284CA8A7|nr:hypothetical protein [Chryseobacterium sp.]MDR3025220.1 hypothetical protein [Chryseobacterium sp.]
MKGTKFSNTNSMGTGYNPERRRRKPVFKVDQIPLALAKTYKKPPETTSGGSVLYQ